MSSVRYILSDIPGFHDIINDNTGVPNILKLNKVECRTASNAVYRVIRYDKDFLSNDLVKVYGLCRSIIVNINNKVVGFAPPKSIPSDLFIQSYAETTPGVVAEEFVEGTMINVFWDDSIGLTGGWEIATRNTVGATSRFYKGAGALTFREMFLEAAAASRLVLDNLEKELCYSFVLQHPQNRIVVPFRDAQLYLVGVYAIHNDPHRTYVDVHDAQQFQDRFRALDTTVKFPAVYPLTTYASLIETYGTMNTSYDIVGVVMHNKETGERAKVRNPVYEQVRNLRGNQPKLQYQYLSLRKAGKVGDFLKFYPENKREFSAFRDQVHLFTNTLFSNYISCYIKKERPLKEFPDQYRTHMYGLHQIYLNDLREKKLFITNVVVINYVNGLHPSLLMYCLNHHMRKRVRDTVIANVVADTNTVEE